MQKKVERQGVRQHLSLGSAAIQHRLRKVFQLFHGPGAGTTGGLIGAHHHPTHRPPGRQRSQSQGEQDRGAIRIGDHAFVGEGRIGIDLGHHQRHTVLHPESTGVIHHHRTGGGDRLAPLLGNRTTGRRQHQVDPLEGLGRNLFHREGAAIPGLGLAGRTGRRQQLQLANGETALFKQQQQFLANSTAGTENCNVERAIGKGRRQAVE